MLWALNTRFSLELDYYRRDTKDMLVTVDVPASVGLTPVETNVGAVRNSGVDFTVKWEDSLKDFRYGIRLTGTTIKNEVISLGGKRIASGDIGAGKSVQMTEEGKPIKYFYGYNVIGIFQNEAQIKEYNERAAAATGNAGQQYQNNVGPGDLIYEDVDGDGYITANDRKDLGSPTPKFIGGLGISASWKGFDLSMVWAGAAGFSIYWGATTGYNAASTEWGSTIAQRVAENHYFYNPENPDDPRTNINAKYPRMAYIDGYVQNRHGNTTLWLYKGDYIKLKNLSLGYTLPKNWVSKIAMQNARVYVSAENLLTITGFEGQDPESATGMGYSPFRTIAIGANITF